METTIGGANKQTNRPAAGPEPSSGPWTRTGRPPCPSAPQQRGWCDLKWTPAPPRCPYIPEYPRQRLSPWCGAWETEERLSTPADGKCTVRVSVFCCTRPVSNLISESSGCFTEQDWVCEGGSVSLRDRLHVYHHWRHLRCQCLCRLVYQLRLDPWCPTFLACNL